MARRVKTTSKELHSEENRERGSLGFYVFLGLLVAIPLFTKFFLADLYYIPSASMAPTLHGAAVGGDRVLVNKTAYWNSEPERDDIVVFKPEGKWEEAYGNSEAVIKRVVATPGETISVNKDGEVSIDGEPLKSPYTALEHRFSTGVLDCETEPKSEQCLPEITIPEDTVWVMGDNRMNSMDSSFGCRGDNDDQECLGPIPTDSIIGKAEAIVFPFDRMGWL